MSVGGQGGGVRPATAFEIRETLDEAVRELSVNVSSLQERVLASGMVILDRLAPKDFLESEDRELFEQIQGALDGAPRSRATLRRPVADQMCDGTAERIAAGILDLRDTMMGRAIRTARMTTHAQARGRPRR
jgi:hypothetical protein